MKNKYIIIGYYICEYTYLPTFLEGIAKKNISSFHSFLCNSLEKQFPDVKFNSYGLLDETYSKTEQMSFSIQGMGEPVDWIPVILHKIEI